MLVLTLDMDHMDMVVLVSGDHLDSLVVVAEAALVAVVRSWNNGAVPNNSYYLRIGNGGQQGGNGYRRFGRHGAVYIWQQNYEQPH